jgi:branched-chain amino acid transport system ATP-binding protein
VLQGVSLTVRRGEVVSLLGRNGAGKTTTVLTIMGFWSPQAGEVRLRGERIAGLPPYEIARRGVGLVPQGRRIFSGLSVEENLTLGARPRSEAAWRLETVWDLFPGLRDRARIPGSALSGGEQQMLAIGRALMTNPELILMDEPSEGLAPKVMREVGAVVDGLRQRGLTILLVEQNLELALQISARSYVMNKGRVVFEGSSEELRTDASIKKQYLGVG